jgi:enoyl-CoA hydratase
MPSTPVTYEHSGGVATIRIDDGKRNALGPEVLEQIDRALDRAERDGATVVLTGRQGVFSAGFDLKVLRGGGVGALRMLNAGFALAERLLGFPTPVVVAVNGHAIAMGSFLVLCGDYRIGVTGDYKYLANEVAIGLTMPRAAVEICRQRLASPHFVRVTALSETYGPAEAVNAGFLDRVVAAEHLDADAAAVAEQLAKLDMKAHAETKQRVRRTALRALRAARRLDMADFAALGVKTLLKSTAKR